MDIFIISHFSEFSHQHLQIVFHWSLRDSKSPQVSMTLLSILADLNNDLFWMVSTCPLISKFPSPCNTLFVTVLSAPMKTGITVTFSFHSFSVLLYGLPTFLFIHFLSVITCGELERQSPLFARFAIFVGLVVWSRSDDPFVPHNFREICVSHFSG